MTTETFATADDGTRLFVRERPGLPVSSFSAAKPKGDQAREGERDSSPPKGSPSQSHDESTATDGVGDSSADRVPLAAAPLVAGALTAFLDDGIGCDGFIWKYLWDFLAERGHNVVHWHYRGHGRSRMPVDPNAIDVKDFARDADAVRRAVGDPPVVLFGHSFGCQVALETYRLRRDNVRGLVLICGSSGRVTYSFKGTDALAQMLPRLIARVEAHPHLARALWGSVPAELALKVATLTGEIDAKLMEPRDLLPYLEHMVDLDLTMFLKMLRLAGEHSAADLLPQIEVPVLVIAGDKDSFTPPALAEEMAKSIPKGELLMLSATHVAALEHRATVNEKIAEFMSRL